MIKAELRRGDGLSSGRIWLRSVVKSMQRGLAAGGHALEIDGKFGSGTKRIVEAFQRDTDIEPSGIVAQSTWRALDPHLQATVGAHEREVQTLLDRFDGDLDWVHEREGHRGRPYWPGGASGVTLDPGVDLGHVPSDRIEALFGPLLTRTQIRTLSQVFGIKGEDARVALNAVPGLKDIRISREQALTLMPHAAKPYWDGIARRFPAVKRQDTPPSVRTVMLSLAYNRGVFNRGLEPLGALLKDRDWAGVAHTVGAMQQRHKLEGIRIRRRQEGSLILAELEFLGSS
jgi:hypothetical protein